MQEPGPSPDQPPLLSGEPVANDNEADFEDFIAFVKCYHSSAVPEKRERNDEDDDGGLQLTWKKKGTRTNKRKKKEVAVATFPIRDVLQSSSEQKDNDCVEQVFDVESVCDHRLDKHGNMQYRIKWVGYDNRYNRWVYKKDMKGCEDLIAEYFACQTGTRKERNE